MTTATAQPRAAKGKKIPPPSSADVKQFGRAFPETMDGTTGKTSQQDNTPAAGEPDGLAVVPRPSPEVKKKLQALSRRMQEIEDKRDELNSAAGLIREEVKNLGVDTATFMYVRRVMKKDKPKREAVDLSHILTRDALGDPMQTDWLDLADGEENGE